MAFLVAIFEVKGMVLLLVFYSCLDIGFVIKVPASCAWLDAGFYIEVLALCAYLVACQIQKKVSCRVAQ
jgi:hypothetical protein